MTVQNDIDLRWVINVILRRFWIIIGCALLGGIIAFAVSYSMPLTYKASVKLMVEPAIGTQSNEYDILVASERLAYTYSQMLTNSSVLKTTIDDLGLQVNPESLAKKITAAPIKDTQLILLTVVDTSPEKASTLVNALADAFIRYIQQMDMRKYTSSLTDNQKKIADLKVLIQQSQTQIDTIAKKRSEDQNRLSVLKENQSGNKADYRLLQSDQQDLRLKLEQLSDHITVAELAQATEINRYLQTNSVTVTLLINQNPLIAGNDYSSILAGEMLASTYGQILISRPIVEAALTKLGSPKKFEDIFNNIRMKTIPGTPLLKLIVRDPDASQAAILANTIAEEFIDQTKSKYQKNYVDQLSTLDSQTKNLSALIDQTEFEIGSLSSSIIQADTEISRLENLVSGYQNDSRALTQNEEQIRLTIVQAADSVTLVEPAHPPSKPVQNRIFIIILAGLVGSMVGITLVFILQYLDNRIHTSADVSAVLGLSVVGVIGRRQKDDPELLVSARPLSPLAEQFRVLTTKIHLILDSESHHNVLLVTSPEASVGKTFISANLAIAMANAGLRVILIDADLRQPRIHQLFRVRKSKGLAGILHNNNKNIGDIDLHPTKVDGLRLITGGVYTENPTQVLNSPQIEDLFTSLKQDSDLIIVDCPPILSLADTQILAAQSNGILMVLRSGKTGNKSAQDAKGILDTFWWLKAVGVVLNDMPVRAEHNYYNTYDYRKKKRSLTRRNWIKVEGFFNRLSKHIKKS